MALKTVAAAMQSCLRQTDILIRYGGDEFLLLMPQNRPDGVESVIRRVRDAVQTARVPSHPELRLSVSIGGVCDVQPLTEATGRPMPGCIAIKKTASRCYNRS